MSLVQTPEEKLAEAEESLAIARKLFQAARRRLKDFDFEHSGSLSPDEAREREALEYEEDEARATLDDAERAHWFAKNEVHAREQGWGRRGGEPWRR